ncbi:MAG: cyclic nucleotide-binding domain-containing protein, partial [Anaerolineales bacterium]|nr:cyclic nucleotide-binding domain-containing protein [Anaerolineales bacterium]
MKAQSSKPKAQSSNPSANLRAGLQPFGESQGRPLTSNFQALSKFPIFEGLTDDELKKIAALCREEVYEAGATVHEEGSVAEYFYIVQDGQVALELELELQPYALPRRTIIEVVTEGEAFGWSA